MDFAVSLNAQLLDLLSRYRPVDAADADMLSRMRAFVSGTAECFERSNLAGHVTGSAWVVSLDGESVLLTHHRKLGKWLQVGGHCDGDRDVARVAMREANEEAGIADLEFVSPEIFDIDIHPIPARGDVPEHLHYDVRFALRSKSDAFIVSDESFDLQWVKLCDLEHLTQERALLRMKEKWTSSLQSEKALKDTASPTPIEGLDNSATQRQSQLQRPLPAYPASQVSDN